MRQTIVTYLGNYLVISLPYFHRFFQLLSKLNPPPILGLCPSTSYFPIRFIQTKNATPLRLPSPLLRRLRHPRRLGSRDPIRAPTSPLASQRELHPRTNPHHVPSPRKRTANNHARNAILPTPSYDLSPPCAEPRPTPRNRSRLSPIQQFNSPLARLPRYRRRPETSVETL